MNSPKFSIGSLVSENSEIYEVLGVTSINEGFTYKLKLLAYLRDMETSEWENQIYSFEASIEETKLNEFKYNKPRYAFGERVKLPYFSCKVKFIKFENHHYFYNVMDETSIGTGRRGGWKVEESYLSK